jgi:hypothetical protein
VALDVMLDNGRSELFWHYELEEIEDKEALRYGGTSVER